MSYRIFLSHHAADHVIADALSGLIDNAFAGHVEPFVSTSISIGENWLVQVKERLITSDEILTVFTHRSAERPWLNIETGYGIMSNLPVTPLLFGGFTATELSVIYRLQQAVEESDDSGILRLFSSILSRLQSKIPRARPKFSAPEFLAEWRSNVTSAILRNPSIGFRAPDNPMIWIIGSHDSLSPREQAEALNVVRSLARVSFANRFRIVCGVSRLLEYLADSHEALAGLGALPVNTPGDPWRKAIGTAHVEAKLPAHNPVILVGSLRTPDIRQRFKDTLGCIPDLVVVVGGRPKASGGRTHEECSAALTAGIPLLPVSFTGGAAAEVQPSLRPEAASLVNELNATQGKLDKFPTVLLRILRAQFGAS